jgi:hypothetical protein
MTQPMQFPEPADGFPPAGSNPVPGGALVPGDPLPGGRSAPGANLAPDAVPTRGEWPRALATSVAVAAGTALLGVAGGFLWAALAPRAGLVMVGRGVADLVDAETNAFIAADWWYCLVALVGGVISGLLGYWLAVRRHGPVAMAGVLVGALAAGLITMWIGQHSGFATLNHLLATLPVGAHLNAQLTLGSPSAIAFWPLAAGLIAGGIELTGAMRDQRQPAAAPLGAAPGYPGAAPGYPGPSPGYPGASADYPGPSPGYPGASSGFLPGGPPGPG